MELLLSKKYDGILYIVLLSCVIRTYSSVVLGPADVDVQLQFSREEESSSSHQPRRERAVSQIEKDALVNSINYQRRQVNASNMEYMKWNARLENIAQHWTNGCNYGATLRKTPAFGNKSSYLHGIKIANQVLDENYQMYIDLLETSFNSGTLSPFYNHFMQYDLRYVGCGIKFCSTLQTPFTYYDMSLTLCIFSYASSTSIKPPGAPGVYALGPPCSNCMTCSYWCASGLCKDDCSSADAACSCFVPCSVCNTIYNANTCRCCSQYCDGFNGISKPCSPTIGTTTPNTPRQTPERLTSTVNFNDDVTYSDQSGSSNDSASVLYIVLWSLCGVFGIIAAAIAIICIIVRRLCRSPHKPRTRRNIVVHENPYETSDGSRRLTPPPAYSPPIPSAPTDQLYTVLDYSSYAIQRGNPPPYPETGITPLNVLSAGDVVGEPPAYSLESASRPRLITVQTPERTYEENQTDTYAELLEDRVYDNILAHANPAFEGDYMPMDVNKY